MSSRLAPAWLLLVSASFVGLWALLFSCELFRVQPLGWEIAFDGSRGAIARSVLNGSAADVGGVRAGDAVLTAGALSIRSRLDLGVVDANLVAGEELRLELLRDGARVPATLTVRPDHWRHWRTREGLALFAARGAQLLTLGVALFIAFRRSRDSMALAGAWFLATAAVASVALPLGFASTWRSLPVPIGALLWIAFVSSGALGGAIFVFFGLFPRRALPPRWLAAAALPLAAPLAMQADLGWRILRPSGGVGVVEPTIAAIVLINAAYVAAGLALALVNYRRLSDLTERRRLRVVLAGAVVGCLTGPPAAVYYWTSSGTAAGQAVMGTPATMAGTLLFLAFPLSLAYAILRHRLFDVRVIVRRGLQYALARRALTWLVPGLIGLLALDLLTRPEATIGESLASRGWVYAVVLTLAVAAQAKRDSWLEMLDRRFFRERYDAQRLLRDFAADIRQSRSFEDLMPRVVGKIEAALHPESAAVLVRQPAEEAFTPFGPAAALTSRVESQRPGQGPPHLARDSKVASLARVLQRPLEIPVSGFSALSRDLPAEERTALHDARIELLIPVIARPDRRELLIALGPKRSEEPYSQEDLDLLATIADGLSLVLDRGRAHSPEPAMFFECNICGDCRDTAGPACACGMASLAPVSIPRRLAGRYRLDRRIGEGGMGTVYAAMDLALQRDVAVKVVRHDLVDSQEARERFERETRMVASFTHPNIVTVHDYGVVPGDRAFIVMELLHGTSLAERLLREGPLAPEAALSILREVCDAMETAHARGIVHRDLKPGNIFLAVDDGGARAKVLDFGIAKLVAARSETSTASASIVGTPPYMAPEQFRGEAPLPAWDVWALTVVAHEMLTGRRPPAGGPVLTGCADAAMNAFFANALSADRNARPQTMRALLAGLVLQIGEGAGN